MLLGKELCQGHSVANCRKFTSRELPHDSLEKYMIRKCEVIFDRQQRELLLTFASPKSLTNHPQNVYSLVSWLTRRER